MKFAWLPLVILFGLIVLAVRSVVRRLGMVKDQLAAYRRGDYRTQLELVEGFRINESEPPDYLFYHGSACFKLGRLDEAERALRTSLEAEKNASLKVICRSQLGRVLMDRQRWEQAESCFRECMAEAPGRGGNQRALAELVLRRGEGAQEALEFARAAVASDRAAKSGGGKLGKEVHDTNLSESLAIFAWAAAANRGSVSEVESALTEAFALCPPTTKPVVSELHFFAGQAYSALGMSDQSSRHFQSAAETDAIGTYGRLAATFA